MALAKPSTTFRAGKLHACLQVLYGDSVIIEVNVLYRYTQSFRNAASEVRQQPDEQTVPEISSSFLQLVYLFGF